MAKWIELREIGVNGVANTVNVDAERIETFGISVLEYKFSWIRMQSGHEFMVSNFPEDIRLKIKEATEEVKANKNG